MLFGKVSMIYYGLIWKLDNLILQQNDTDAFI